MIIPFGVPVPFWMLVVGALMSGASVAIFSLIWTNTLQELVPCERLGHVVSIDMLGSFVLLPVGFGVAG